MFDSCTRKQNLRCNMGQGPGKYSDLPGGSHSQLPEDPPGRRYVSMEYQLMERNIHLHSSFFGGSGKKSDLKRSFPQIFNLYRYGFELTKVMRIPMVAFREDAGLMWQFQVIALKPLMSNRPNDKQLRIKESYIDTKKIDNLIQTRVLGQSCQLWTDIQGIAQQGGRLLCMARTGGFDSSMFSSKRACEVLLFYDVPTVSTNSYYVYHTINVPVLCETQTFNKHWLTMCDWHGQFTAFLNVGWKLVDIEFSCESLHKHGGGLLFTRSIRQNSVWFFEKEASRLHDCRPQYEGTIITYYHRVKVIDKDRYLFKAKNKWNDLIYAMALKGYELATIVETPERRSVDRFNQKEIKILFFFQRKIQAPPVNSASSAFNQGAIGGLQTFPTAPPSFPSLPSAPPISNQDLPPAYSALDHSKNDNSGECVSCGATAATFDPIQSPPSYAEVIASNPYYVSKQSS